MERRGKRSTPQSGDASAGLDEVELGIEADAVVDAEAAVEVEEVDAAAQEHMLTIVDHLGVFIGRRHRIGCRAAAEKAARFVEIDLKARFAQSRRSRQSGESS